MRRKIYKYKKSDHKSNNNKKYKIIYKNIKLGLYNIYKKEKTDKNVDNNIQIKYN